MQSEETKCQSAPHVTLLAVEAKIAARDAAIEATKKEALLKVLATTRANILEIQRMNEVSSKCNEECLGLIKEVESDPNVTAADLSKLLEQIDTRNLNAIRETEGIVFAALVRQN